MLIPWLIFFLAQEVYQDTTSILVLMSGQEMKLKGPYSVKDTWVIFSTDSGQVVQLPLQKVNLEKSELATKAYHQKRLALLNAKPAAERSPQEIPQELYAEKEKQQAATAPPPPTRSSAQKDPYGIDEAWAVFENGEKLIKKGLSNEEEKELRTQLDTLSQKIWDLKATIKAKNLESVVQKERTALLTAQIAEQREAVAKLVKRLDRS